MSIFTDFVNLLEDYIRYDVENFRVQQFFDGLLNDISHFVIG